MTNLCSGSLPFESDAAKLHSVGQLVLPDLSDRHVRSAQYHVLWDTYLEAIF